MPTLTASTFRHIGACVACVIVEAKLSGPLEGTEFSGGSVTGLLLTIHQVSLVLFLTSAAVILGSRRGATIVALVACLLSLPLCLYFTVPGLFRRALPGEYLGPAARTRRLEHVGSVQEWRPSAPLRLSCSMVRIDDRERRT